jgi:hypothetical protein
VAAASAAAAEDQRGGLACGRWPPEAQRAEPGIRKICGRKQPAAAHCGPPLHHRKQPAAGGRTAQPAASSRRGRGGGPAGRAGERLCYANAD